MSKVLIVTHDLVGTRMAGPAIRCFELAKQLAKSCEVTLTSLLPLEGKLEADFRIVSFEDDFHRLMDLAQTHDVLLLQGLMHRRYPALLGLGKKVVMDLYDPFVFESYPHFLAQPNKGMDVFLNFWDVQNEAMEVADFSVCASERQRDMYLGRYCALGRLRPELFETDPSFRKLIDVVPFGISDEPIKHERKVLKGVVPGIRPDDKVLLWGGGIWNWFDPLTVIRAVAKIAETRNDVKLYFLGVKHPNPEIPEMEMTNRAVELATELGLMDTHVFFNHGWVPYSERQNYLAEADIGISSHFDSIETRFSFRTRVLDYLWAGLPIISTEGDAMAELVASRGLGATVAYESVEDWVSAIHSMLEATAFTAGIRERVRLTAEELRWSKVAQPLVRYCLAPYEIPRPYWSVTGHFGSPWLPKCLRLVVKSVHVLRTGGLPLFFEKGARFIGKRLKPRTLS